MPAIFKKLTLYKNNIITKDEEDKLLKSMYIYTVNRIFNREMPSDIDRYVNAYVEIERLLKAYKLSSIYKDNSRFSSYLTHCINECLLAVERYEEYLNLTEQQSLFQRSFRNNNTRCNLFYYLNKPANPIDIIMTSYDNNYGDMIRNLTGFTLKNKSQFESIITSLLLEDAQKNGPLLNRILGNPTKSKTTKYYMFSGVAISDKYRPKLKIPYYKFYSSSLLKKMIPALMRKAENLLRDGHSVPRVGEGWISETSLYQAIKNAFLQTQVIQHGRPEWLGMQHLDIWIPAWKIAIEYHGKQHFEPVDYFGGLEAYEANKKRDARKEMLCKDNDVKLIIVTEDNSHDQVIEMIKIIKKINDTDGRVPRAKQRNGP